MKISTDWLDQLFELSYEEAWARIHKEVAGLVTTTEHKSPKGYYTILEREVNNIESILSQSAWDLWENFHSSPRASGGVVDFWDKTVGPKAVLILDSLSIREAGVLINRLESFGLTLSDFSVAGSEIPSETDLYANALGLRGRASLKKQSAPASFRLSTEDSYIDSFKQLPFKDCAERLPAQKNQFVWHSWPDDSVHDKGKVEDSLNYFIDHVDSVFSSEGFKAFIKAISTGRQLLVTSDHGYCHSGSFQTVSGNGKEELKFLGHKRAKPISNEEVMSGKTIPPVTLDLKATSADQIYRVAVGKRRPPDRGFPSLTHGGLSLMECCVPLIQVKEV